MSIASMLRRTAAMDMWPALTRKVLLGIEPASIANDATLALGLIEAVSQNSQLQRAARAMLSQRSTCCQSAVPPEDGNGIRTFNSALTGERKREVLA